MQSLHNTTFYVQENRDKTIFCDYIAKIKERFYILGDKDFPKRLNALLVFFNYCFKTKNSFFVDSYNPKNIIFVNNFYNELKTNIFNTNLICVSDEDIFKNIDKNKTKNAKFVIKNFVNNYEKIINDTKHNQNRDFEKFKAVCLREDLSIICKML